MHEIAFLPFNTLVRGEFSPKSTYGLNMDTGHVKLTYFYHPIKIIFLDDDQIFLNTLSLEFGHRKDMVMLTDPDSAMFLIKQSKTNMLASNNDGNFFDTIYEKSRFNHVAVLVVDYTMPTINGVEFCNKLKDQNIFKILLTAQADKDIAIDAFNNGTIDKFILKTTDYLYEEILTAIDELTFKYFNERSKLLPISRSEQLQRILNNDSYKKIFNDVMTKNNAIEYYLIDDLGSCLFLDKNSKPLWLIICDQKKANEQADLLGGYNFPEETIKKIQGKENILFFLSDSEYKEPSLNWKKYIFEAKKLDDNYSYSIVSGQLTHSISWSNIAPYEN